MDVTHYKIPYLSGWKISPGKGPPLMYSKQKRLSNTNKAHTLPRFLLSWASSRHLLSTSSSDHSVFRTS